MHVCACKVTDQSTVPQLYSMFTNLPQHCVPVFCAKRYTCILYNAELLGKKKQKQKHSSPRLKEQTVILEYGSCMNFQSKFFLRWTQYSPWVAIIRTLTQNVNCNMLSAFLLENGFYLQNRIMTMLYCRSKWNPNKILSTKLVETLWLKEPFWNFADLKWKNEVFPSPSPIKQWYAVAWQDKTRCQDDLLNSVQFYMTYKG